MVVLRLAKRHQHVSSAAVKSVALWACAQQQDKMAVGVGIYAGATTELRVDATNKHC